MMAMSRLLEIHVLATFPDVSLEEQAKTLESQRSSVSLALKWPCEFEVVDFVFNAVPGQPGIFLCLCEMTYFAESAISVKNSSLSHSFSAFRRLKRPFLQVVNPEMPSSLSSPSSLSLVSTGQTPELST